MGRAVPATSICHYTILTTATPDFTAEMRKWSPINAVRPQALDMRGPIASPTFADGKAAHQEVFGG
jgi:hypothetical protein